jgi:fimbrial chaperone protein
LTGFAVVVLALWQGPAGAGSFQVNPIRIDLSGKAASAALTVKNTGAEPVVVQLSAETWSQQDGKDVYAPTREILVTPPIVTIPAGAERIVRTGLRRQPDPQNELSYRLFLQEVPPPPQPGFQGLIVALRIGLPVFVQPQKGSAAPRLTWEAQRQPDNKIQLRVRNDGTAHVQIAELQMLAAGASEPFATQSALSYVLPGQAREWSLPVQSGASPNSRVRLKAITDAGNIDTEIPLANP